MRVRVRVRVKVRLDVISLFSGPGDGDQDCLLATFTGAILYFENAGSRTAPSYVLRTGALNPFDGQLIGQTPTPNCYDIDLDGRSHASLRPYT